MESPNIRASFSSTKETILEPKPPGPSSPKPPPSPNTPFNSTSQHPTIQKHSSRFWQLSPVRSQLQI